MMTIIVMFLAVTMYVHQNHFWLFDRVISMIIMSMFGCYDLDVSKIIIDIFGCDNLDVTMIIIAMHGVLMWLIQYHVIATFGYHDLAVTMLS